MFFKNNRRKGAKIISGDKFYVLEWIWETTPEDIQRKADLAILNEKIRVRDLERADKKKALN